MSTLPSDVNRILIVRPTALGDVARTVPVLVSLKQAYPQARIDWLVHDAFADVIRHHPALGRIVPFPRKRFAGMMRNPAIFREVLQWARQLGGEKYDLVFDVQGLFRSGLFTWLTRAPRRVGFADARELGWLGYNHRHRVDPSLHTVDHMLGLLEAHGLSVTRDMRLYVGEDDARWLHEHIDGDEPYAVLAPTARWLCKCWPMERYGEIAQRLLDAKKVTRLFVLASGEEQAWIAPLRQRFAGNAAVIFPATTIGRMMALISRAALLVCNDSAALHIGVGFDRRIVTIFGPTDPAKVGPYRRPDTFVQPPNIEPRDMRDYRGRRDDQSLIARVPIDAVWQRIVQTMV